MSATKTVQNLNFNAFDAQKAALVASGVRIFGNAPGEAATVTVSEDFEPEFIAVSGDGTQAFVALQENNAFAVVDLNAGQITDIVPLGYKDHGLPGNGLDASDQDAGVDIETFQNLFGMYQPDGIASFEINGKTYYGSANEGDARGFEEERVNSLTLDAMFPVPNASDNDVLGRLEVTTTLGDTDTDGDYDEIYVYGARSFSIWDEDGNLVYDSEDMIEQILAASYPQLLNNSRADAKGPEPRSDHLWRDRRHAVRLRRAWSAAARS